MRCRRIVLLAFSLAGCREPYLNWQVFRSPGRPPMVDIQCEYRRDCIRVAHRACRHGFDIVDSGVQVERNHVAQAFEDFGAQQQKRVPKNYTRVDSALTVQCLAPPASVAPPPPPATTATTAAQPRSQPPQPIPSDPALARDPWQ